jgi:hypothetical protein
MCFELYQELSGVKVLSTWLENPVTGKLEPTRFKGLKKYRNTQRINQSTWY